MTKLILSSNTIPNGDKPKSQSIHGSINHTKFRISGHRLKWSWHVEGTTNRSPDKRIKVGKGKGWFKNIYHWHGATIVLNPYTMEIWMKSRPYKTVERMVSAKWSKADLIAREFSEYAQIAITPIESEHPQDIQAAHLVVETKPVSALLEPYKDRPDSRRIGLEFDKSHRNRAELTGQESVEGGMGLDWLLLDFPQQHRMVVQALSGFERYNANIEKHLEVLDSMDKTLKQIQKGLRKR